MDIPCAGRVGWLVHADRTPRPWATGTESGDFSTYESCPDVAQPRRPSKSSRGFVVVSRRSTSKAPARSPRTVARGSLSRSSRCHTYRDQSLDQSPQLVLQLGERLAVAASRLASHGV